MEIKQFIDIMIKLFSSLQSHHEKEKEIAEMIKQELNKTFTNIQCKKVFISNGNNYKPFIINVIPCMPKGNILNIDCVTEYDIDIDLDSFMSMHDNNGMDAEELACWLLHELYANVITDETLLRYKRLLIKYYDTNNSSIMDTIKSLGKLLWIGIFSRTAKAYINEDDTSRNSFINNMLLEMDLQDSWNSALSKYICIEGGSSDILSEEYLHRVDKTQLREFNSLARKYSSYILKYNNTDYSTMIKYIISSTNSKLIKHYCEKEPDQMIVFKEKDVYNLFDDRRLLLEQSEGDIQDDKLSLMKTRSAAELNSEYTDIELDSSNIQTSSEKLKLSARLKDFIVKVSNKLLECDAYDNEPLNLLREKANSLLDKISNMNIDNNLYIVDIM